MKKLMKKILGLPDFIYNRVILAYRGVAYGANLTIHGRLYCVSNTKNGIVIGDHVSINSNRKSNPIGGDTKTTLFAKDKGKIRIGNHCGLSNVTIFANESVVIGNQVLLGGSTKIYDTDFHWLDLEKRMNEKGSVTKPVEIKDGVFVGAHSIILKGVTIGEGSVIGAGSVVAKSIPAGEIWAGNPAKFIRKI